MKTFGRGTPYLIAMCDVDGFVSGRSKDTGLSDCGQFLSAQQREQGPLADVHHGSGETQPSPPGRRSQGWRGWGGRDRRGVTRRWEDARRGRGRRCWRWWGAGSRIIPADTDRKKKQMKRYLWIHETRQRIQTGLHRPAEWTDVKIARQMHSESHAKQ